MKAKAAASPPIGSREGGVTDMLGFLAGRGPRMASHAKI